MSQEDKRIEIKCTSGTKMPLKDLLEFQGDLKSLLKENFQKLRNFIEELGFTAPVFVWKNHNQILDGTQRCRVLKEMIKDGWTLEDGLVPVDEITAATEREAKKILLGYISQFGKIEDQGLYQFLDGLEDVDSILKDVDLPDFNIERFTANFLEDTDFTPDTTPLFSTAEVLDEDVVKEKAKLDDRFKEDSEYLKVICPHCAEEFFINKKDVK